MEPGILLVALLAAIVIALAGLAYFLLPKPGKDAAAAPAAAAPQQRAQVSTALTRKPASLAQSTKGASGIIH